MSLRILIGCANAPGWGGACTSAYALFEAMQAEGLDVAFLSLVERDEAAFLEASLGTRMGNPRGLPDADSVVLDGSYPHPQREIEDQLARIAPDVILAVGSVAAAVLPVAAPAVPVVFLTTGCEQLKALVVNGAFPDYVAAHDDIVSAATPIGLPTTLERRAVERASLVVTHSEATLLLMERIHRPHGANIHPEVVWFAEWIHGEAARYATIATPFAARTIDVLFIASSWQRPEKNLRAIEALARRLPEHELHVVGVTDDEIAGVTQHGLVAREQLFALMGSAKTVACVSTFDAAPGILFEAAAMGCNVVASRNCGNWRICHDDLLVEPFTTEAFAAVLRRATTRRFPDDLAYFLRTDSYATLKRLLASAVASTRRARA